MKELQVDFVTAQALPGGRLGLTVAPGKAEPGAEARDLRADLNRLTEHYEANTLLSLLEPAEFELLGIPELLTKARTHGMNVLHCPIPDFGVPPGPQSVFSSFVHDVHDRLLAGETVIVHCRGGKGRSGLVAAAVLVAAGHDPASAIRHVRSARNGAIETMEQEQFVRAFAGSPVQQKGK